SGGASRRSWPEGPRAASAPPSKRRTASTTPTRRSRELATKDSGEWNQQEQRTRSLPSPLWGGSPAEAQRGGRGGGGCEARASRHNGDPPPPPPPPKGGGGDPGRGARRPKKGGRGGNSLQNRTLFLSPSP